MAAPKRRAARSQPAATSSTAAATPPVAAVQPAHHAWAPRQAPEADWSTTSDLLGITVTVTSNADGIIMPQSSDQVRLCDVLGLPVIRKE